MERLFRPGTWFICPVTIAASSRDNCRLAVFQHHVETVITIPAPAPCRPLMRSAAAAAIAATAPLRRLAPAKETRQTELLGFRLAHACTCVCIWLVLVLLLLLLLLLRRRGQRTVRCIPNARHGHRRGGQQQVRQFLPVCLFCLVGIFLHVHIHTWWCGSVVRISHSPGRPRAIQSASANRKPDTIIRSSAERNATTQRNASTRTERT